MVQSQEHTHTHILRHSEVFFKRSGDQTQLENAWLVFMWQPGILNPFKRGCGGRNDEKIGRVSHNLCSVNFPAYALTVYRVLHISCSLPPPPPTTTYSLFFFMKHPPPTFVAYVFWIFFFVSLVWMLSLGVAKFTSLYMTHNTNKETNKSNVKEREEQRRLGRNKSICECLSLLKGIHISMHKTVAPWW